MSKIWKRNKERSKLSKGFQHLLSFPSFTRSLSNQTPKTQASHHSLYLPKKKRQTPKKKKPYQRQNRPSPPLSYQKKAERMLEKGKWMGGRRRRRVVGLGADLRTRKPNIYRKQNASTPSQVQGQIKDSRKSRL